MVMGLVRRGADPLMKDKQGGTAADWAKLRGYGDVVEALRKTRFEPEPQRRPGGLVAPPSGTVKADRQPHQGLP